jgi:hypothetical protein
LGNDYITPIPGEYDNLASEKGHSQADVIADVTINKIKLLDGIINSRGLAVTDEEIIKKTILDDLVIEDLRKARGDNKIGIEGIILEDFKETAVKMVEIVSKLKTVEEGSKEEKNLKEELSILEKKSSDILEGKKSMDYFNQISLFFNPSVAKDYIITDKITYTKEVYGKDYYTLPEEGEGLTKKTIKEEFKEFIDSTDIRKKLRLATNYFLTIEKDFNKSLVDYTETNYAEHRKLVKDKIKSLSEIGLSISKADPETQEQLISYYAVLAQEIEELTGKRILPWESIKVDLNNQIKEKYLKSSSTKSINAQLNESIDENTTKNDVLDGIINNIINTLPTEQLNFSIISRYVNIGIQEYNNKIADKIKELQQSEETLSEETLKEIENLEKEFIELNVGLNISELEEFIILPEKGKSYLDEIIENGQTKGDFIKSLLDITQREDLKS